MKKNDTEVPFIALLHQFNDAIRSLPICESKYWLDLLRYAIQTEETPWTRALLQQALHFTGELRIVLSSKQVNSLHPNLLISAKQSLNALVKTAKTHTFGVLGTQLILTALGGFLSIIMGCIGAILGACAGLIRGIWHLSPLKHMGLGLLTSGILFGMAGNRALKKYCKDPLFRQIKFTLDALEATFQDILNRQFPAFDQYREQAKNYLIEHYFDNQAMAFEAFRTARVKCAIKTQRAEFFDASMKGILGHHAYFCAEINGKLLGIELTPYPTDLKIPAVQSENRETTGEQILEMYTFHLALLPTRNLMDPLYLWKFKAADKYDCFFHLDQVLSVANEPPRSQVRRFFQESPRGELARMVTENLSPWPPVLEFR